MRQIKLEFSHDDNFLFTFDGKEKEEIGGKNKRMACESVFNFQQHRQAS